VAAPHWLAAHLDDSWGKRYAARIDTWRMPASATKKNAHYAPAVLGCHREPIHAVQCQLPVPRTTVK
jgi:hypothetical protein